MSNTLRLISLNYKYIKKYEKNLGCPLHSYYHLNSKIEFLKDINVSHHSEFKV